MRTFYNFTPTSVAPYQFQPTLDGEVYNATVVWLIGMAQRWYLQLQALDGTLIFLQALIGSPSAIPIASVSWANGQITIATTQPHGFQPLATADITVSGMVPTTYNGTWRAFIIDPYTLTFELSSDPGTPSVIGSVSYDINMGQSYFQTSSIVFREATQQFEISP